MGKVSCKRIKDEAYILVIYHQKILRDDPNLPFFRNSDRQTFSTLMHKLITFQLLEAENSKHILPLPMKQLIASISRSPPELPIAFHTDPQD